MRHGLRIILLVFVLSAFSASASASPILYSFSFTPTSGQGPIESFGISFTVPTFVTSGQSPAFTPVTITDGTHSAILSQDLAENSGSGTSCFEFGTADTTLNFGGVPCSQIEVGPTNAGVFFLAIAGTLPTTIGTFGAGTNVAIFDGLGTGFAHDFTGGTATLTITTTPEPASGLLLLTGLLAVAFVARKRTTHQSL